MASVRIGVGSLWVGDAAPDECGCLWVDNSGANPRLRVQIAAAGAGGAPISVVDGLGLGTVTAVTATAPVVSSGGAAPDISITVGTGAGSVAAGDDARFLTSVEDSAAQRVLMSCLAPGGAGFLLVSGVGYWVYLGRVVKAFTPKHVEFHLSTVGAGAQTVEVGFFSTPSAPKKAAQSLTKLVASATVDSLTVGTGVKRNTTPFATSIAAGTHLWAGIRTAMATTQPTIWGLGVDMGQGQILFLAAAGALTGAGPFAGGLIAAGTGVGCPDLRGVLD